RRLDQGRRMTNTNGMFLPTGKLDFETKVDLIALYGEGWNTGQLARRFGITREAVRKLLRTHGVEVRSRWHRKPAVNRSERDEFGCIVTVREQKTRELRSLHEPGKRREALERICLRIDRLAGDWKIISYSTPETIATDLQGSRQKKTPERA